MEIIIDQREPSKLKQYFLSTSYTVHLQNLQLGDIIIKTPELELIIERKTIDDLASSIRDGRLREQKIRLIKKLKLLKITQQIILKILTTLL